MISYAQNREDVVLWRLVDLVPRGRYIDVGAGHPIIENVTYALYVAGWRGVNVEPMAREVALLREERPDDLTLHAAAGSAPGRLVLFEAPLENRGATTSDAGLAERYRSAGQPFGEFEVDVITLHSIIDDLPPGDIHVLKIDVEGMEAAVIAGAELAVHRPWVLVIEATSPNTSIDASSAWEPSVLAAGYELTLFDGLNRFYVRSDLPDVRSLMSTPANVFDHAVPREVSELRALVADGERFAAAVKDDRRRAEAYAASLQAEIEIVRADAEEAQAYARTLELEREAAAPHIADLQRRAALVDELQQRCAALEQALGQIRT